MRYLASLTATLLAILAGPSSPKAGAGFLAIPGPDGRELRFVADLGNMRCVALLDGLAFVMAEAADRKALDREQVLLPDLAIAGARVGDKSMISRYVVRLDFVDANPGIQPQGRGALPGNVNLYLGRDRSRWRLDSRRFAEIVYEELWPGVDLVLRPGDSGLAYELVYADPQFLKAVGLTMKGGTPLQSKGNEEGVSTALGDLFVSPPFGQASLGRVWCDASTDKSAAAKKGLPTQATPLASSVSWSTYLGGNAGEALSAVVSDEAGRVFVIGDSDSGDYPTTPGASPIHEGGESDVVMTAMDTQTGYLLWSTYLGGDDYDQGCGACVLPNGNLMAVGRTWSSDFPTTPDVWDSTRETPEAGFIAEVDAATGHLVWCTLLEGGHARAAAATAGGAIVIAGDTDANYLSATTGAFDESFNGGAGDGFVARLSNQGRNLDWCTYLGSSEEEQLLSLKLDESDQPIVSGGTGLGTSPSFPVTAQAYDQTGNGGFDGFVSKLSADGSGLVWSTFIGGGGDDWPECMTLQDNGDIVLGGYTGSRAFPVTTNAYQTERHGIFDGTISTLSADGSTLIQSTYLGSDGIDFISGISISRAGTIVVTGSTTGPTFPGPLGRDQYATHNTLYPDAFLSQLDVFGQTVLSSVLVGGTDYEQIVQHCWTSQGAVIMGGVTASADFPVTPACFDSVWGGGPDIFVLKMESVVTSAFLKTFRVLRDMSGALVEWEIGPDGTACLVRLWREAEPGTRAALAEWTSVGSGEIQYLDSTAPQGEASYWLQVIDGKGQEQWYGPVSLAAATLPARLALAPNAPNPFNPRTTIRYSLPQATPVRLSIYDLQGRLVRGLVNESRPAGEWSAEWDGRDDSGRAVASGSYVVRLVTDQGVRSSKVTLAK